MLSTLLTDAVAQRLTAFVVDSVNNEPVPYASITFAGKSHHQLADANGKFVVPANLRSSKLVVTAMGFQADTLELSQHRGDKLTIYIQPIGIAISEVVVKPRKEKYSKKNNPAVDLSRRIAENRDKINPRHHAYFSQKKYERYALGFNNIDPTSKDNVAFKKFEFLRDYVDTSDVTGKPILMMSLRELSYDEHFRSEPKKEMKVLTGVQHDGIDDFLDQENLRVFLDDVLGDVDIFKNDVTLLQNRFVSPFSPIAPDFYKFYITDTIQIDSKPFIELSFVPRNSQSFGFTGKIYVEKDDPNTFIRKVVMNVPKEINLNFVDRLYIHHEYERGPDSCMIKTMENLTAELQIMPGTPGLYASKRSSTYDHKFDIAPADSVFDRVGDNYTVAEAETRGPVYWLLARRQQQLTDKEQKISTMMESLHQNKFFYWTQKIISILFNGYINTSSKSKFDIGPMNSIISYNEIEGYRFRVGGMTTANLSKRLFGRGYLAYGTDDHEFKYRGELEYSFNDKKYHSREFPIHSVRAAYQYDVDMVGQKYLYQNPDNMVLSIRRKKNLQMTYLRQFDVDYTLEMMNNFSVEFGASWQRQYATKFMPFKIVGAGEYDSYDETMFRLKLRYAPGEKFYQNKSNRVHISLDAPMFTLEHTYAPRNAFGNLYGINRTEASIQKRFWMSAFGYLDVLVKGGHVWGGAPYPSLLIPNANLSYTIQPESYSLMNAMEFVNDSYASIDLTYWANGALFNYIPYFKKLKLREVATFKCLWGHLSHRNDPSRTLGTMEFPAIANTQRMTNQPYMEASVGVENIFKVLRIDYVWRLSYLNNPNIDKHGLRIAVHVTF